MNNQNITIFHDSDSQEPYSPLFTDSQIKGRLRVIDTSTDTWDIGESEAILINFNLLNVHNVELIDQFKYTIAWFVKSKSPSHALAIFNAVKYFLNSCEFLDDSGEELAEVLADEVCYYFANNRKSSSEDRLALVRLWYQHSFYRRLWKSEKSKNIQRG
ncbi:hypothetical protein D6V22_09460 [Vibrio cholerae]|nr:hypothetical protein [Vibrio cholerae]MVB52877.1 hypothetical protein [Vibrio cholerae]MVB75615.1 hypothetical protein [Vibrio cholerae]MVB77386.1 hypothetical protein [Vibrio cholerae]MVC41923.1 hypothetical protein [Vibrio cholerae]